MSLGISAASFLLLVGCVTPLTPSEALETEVRELIDGYRGDIGVYAKNLRTTETFSYHGDDLFCTASVFKVPVMVELFRQAERGEVNLRDRRTPSTKASMHGTGILSYLQDAPELSLLDYCRLMIVYSDNIATDTIMETIDPAAVTATMERLGLSKTRVNGNVTQMHYGMMGSDAVTGSAELDEQLMDAARSGGLVLGGFANRSLSGNVTTPREMGILLEKLHLGEVVSRLASESMLDVMKDTRSSSMIPKHLPSGTVVAHKTGGTWRVKANVGIAYLESGPVVISVFAFYEPEEKRAAEILAEIARLIADWAQ